ncbi:MAG: Gfo/Idh/MocA family oxidoreductase [Thermoanaerobaculales bacterium]
MLDRLQALQDSIKVAVIGVGSAGKGLVYQCERTPGMQCVAIADINLARAAACAEFTGREFRVVSEHGALQDAIREKKLAVCEDGELLTSADGVGVLIESSSSVAAGARHALSALRHRKHVVMMNAEADLVFGPALLRAARENGVVYTSCEGDQPADISRLVAKIRLWGFELVMAGNVKGFLDRYADPTSIVPEADKRGLDPKMCASYTDGSKLNIEMALVANAFGCAPIVAGMQGPRAAHVRDALRLFDLEALWRTRRPLVEYVLGAEPKGGIFVVGYCDDPYQRSMLSWLPPAMGDGPFYVFYRPYHLVHVEAMECVADAALDGRALLQPWSGLRTNVYTYAKRDLHEGEVLDGIGGYTCYGLIDESAHEEESAGLPICLCEGLTLRRSVSKDQKLLMRDVKFDPGSFEYRLFLEALHADDGASS